MKYGRTPGWTLRRWLNRHHVTGQGGCEIKAELKLRVHSLSPVCAKMLGISVLWTFLQVIALLGFSAAGNLLLPAAVMAAVGNSSDAEGSLTTLSKKSQNPLENIVTFTTQYNLYSGGSLGGSPLSMPAIHSLLPARLNPDWNLFTRIIFPFNSVPTPGGTVQGTGDSQVSFFFSPRQNGKTAWGAGPTFQLPTASQAMLGNQTFGIGPTAAVVRTESKWVYGALTHYLFSVGDSPTGFRTNQFFIQPFAYYNFPGIKGLSLGFSPTITCDLTRRPGDQWTVPVGVVIAQTMKIDKQPFTLSLGTYYNAVRTAAAPEWNIKFQIAWLFPQPRKDR